MRLKDKLAGCSHIEGVVRKATSNDPNPPKRESLSEMKAVTFKSDHAELVMLMESLLQRYREDKAVWRHQYKALICHEYLLRHGSAKFVELSIKYKRFVEALQRNGPPDPLNQIAYADREKVQELATKVLTLINDPGTLEIAKTRTTDSRGAQRNSGSFSYGGEDAELARALALSKQEYEREQGKRGAPAAPVAPAPVAIGNMTDEELARREQAELEAAIALSKATALEEQMHKGGDDLPWWEVKPQSATAAPSKPLMEEANDIFDVFSKPSTPAAAPFAPPARTGAAASPFGGSDPFGGSSGASASSPFGASAPFPPPARSTSPAAFPPPSRSPTAAAPAASDPFGAKSPWDPVPVAPKAPASDPFGASPFGAPAASAPAPSPFGAPASDPFGAKPAASPFGAPAVSSPFGAPAAAPSPFGAPASSPWGAPAATSSPFGAAAPAQPANPASLFGVGLAPLEPAKSPVPGGYPATQAPPSSSPFGAPASSPWGAPARAPAPAPSKPADPYAAFREAEAEAPSIFGGAPAPGCTSSPWVAPSSSTGSNANPWA